MPRLVGSPRVPHGRGCRRRDPACAETRTTHDRSTALLIQEQMFHVKHPGTFSAPPPPTTRRDSRRAITTGMRLRPVRCDDRSATRTDLSWRPERDDAAFPERARKRLGSISTSPPSPSLFPVPNESTLRRKPCVQMFHVKHPGSAAPLRGFVAKSIRNRYLGYTSSERTARGCAQFRAETELP